MTNRTPQRFGNLSCKGAVSQRKLRALAGLMLLLAVMLSFAWGDLHAQPGPGEFKKDEKKKEEIKEKALPLPPAVSLSQSTFGGAPQPVPVTSSPTPTPHLRFHIDPNSKLSDLLPTPPKATRIAGPLLGNDLSRVPEVRFEAPQDAVNELALKLIAHQMAKINHLNNKKTDGFMEALRNERPDLVGLPFAMGDACRTKGERSKQFALAVAMVRQALQPEVRIQGRIRGETPPAPVRPIVGLAQPEPSIEPGPKSEPQPLPPAGENLLGSTVVFFNGRTIRADIPPIAPDTFWEQYQTLCSQQDKQQAQARPQQRETITLARIAALTQILLPMAEMHTRFAKYLSAVSHPEATRTLARLAIFSSEADARKAALDALKVRRERDYTDILLNGLRYPLPAVARRAAVAIAKLERNDLLPKLINVLEQPDPRAPVMRQVKDKRVPVVRELVRVNHHRSCLLCHAPGNTGKVSSDAVTAEVPVPGQPLNPPTGPYNTSRQDILVRVDVTYLRQDFSALQAVADANPWPEMQRFDFLVRTRELSEDEAESYREKLEPRDPGEFSPYQRAALAALRELTGRDTEPTPAAWRRLLKLPSDSPRKTATP